MGKQKANLSSIFYFHLELQGKIVLGRNKQGRFQSLVYRVYI